MHRTKHKYTSQIHATQTYLNFHFTLRLHSAENTKQTYLNKMLQKIVKENVSNLTANQGQWLSPKHSAPTLYTFTITCCSTHRRVREVHCCLRTHMHVVLAVIVIGYTRSIYGWIEGNIPLLPLIREL